MVKQSELLPFAHTGNGNADQPDRTRASALAIFRQRIAKKLSRHTEDGHVVIRWFAKRALSGPGLERSDAERHRDRPATQRVAAKAPTDTFRETEERRFDLRRIQGVLVERVRMAH